MKKSLLAVISVMLSLILTTSCWVLGISANKKYSEYKVAVQSQSSEKYELHAESSYGAELTCLLMGSFLFLSLRVCRWNAVG